jgi:hypothetical protein
LQHLEAGLLSILEDGVSVLFLVFCKIKGKLEDFRILMPTIYGRSKA